MHELVSITMRQLRYHGLLQVNDDKLTDEQPDYSKLWAWSEPALQQVVLSDEEVLAMSQR